MKLLYYDHPRPHVQIITHSRHLRISHKGPSLPWTCYAPSVLLRPTESNQRRSVRLGAPGEYSL